MYGRVRDCALAEPSRSGLPALLLVTLLAAAGAQSGCGQQDAAATSASAAVPVKTTIVTTGTLTRELRRTGEVRPEVEVRVFSQVPDRILDLRVDEGMAVRKDQVIAVIQADALDAGVAQAAASLESARVQQEKLRDDLARAQKLLVSNVTSEAQVEALRKGLAAAEAQVRSLEAVVEQASTRQRQSLVRAPISGIVGQRLLSRGDLAAPTTPIVTLVQIDRVKVVLQATEFDLPFLGMETQVEIRVAAYPDELFTGKVSRVSPVIDQLSRHAQVEILLDNKDHRLKPGMLAEISVVLERRTGVLAVPHFSLMLDEGVNEDGSPRYHAFVVEEGKASKRTVLAGLLDGEQIEIREGLKRGEQLVIRGQQLLEDGSPVEVVEDAGSEKSPAGKDRGGGAAAPTAGADAKRDPLPLPAAEPASVKQMTPSSSGAVKEVAPASPAGGLPALPAPQRSSGAGKAASPEKAR